MTMVSGRAASVEEDVAAIGFYQRSEAPLSDAPAVCKHGSENSDL